MARGYKTQCPSCGGHNFYVTPDNGVGYCFNCGFRQTKLFSAQLSDTHHSDRPASAQEIAAYRQLYTELAAYYHSCLEPAHRKWLHARGLTDETINKFKIGYVPRSLHSLYRNEFAERAGVIAGNVPFLAGRIVFPYLLNRVVYDMRGRSLQNSEPKYLSLRGSSRFRGATIVYNADVLREKPETLVVTEGEIKALASQQAGIATVAFPGIRSMRDLMVSSAQRIVICFDNQARHYYDVYRAIVDLATSLLPFTQQIFVALLPLTHNGQWIGREKIDIDSYILQYGAENYRNLINTAIPYLRFLQLARGFRP